MWIAVGPTGWAAHTAAVLAEQWSDWSLIRVPDIPAGRAVLQQVGLFAAQLGEKRQRHELHRSASLSWQGRRARYARSREAEHQAGLHPANEGQSAYTGKHVAENKPHLHWWEFQCPHQW